MMNPMTAATPTAVVTIRMKTVAIIDIPRAAVLGFFYFLWVIW
jgi:hypothetical protein